MKKFVTLVGVITCVTGAFQAVAPTVILSPMHAAITDTSVHFFRIVGMFMALFGGLLLQTLRAPALAAPVPLFWCGLQKVGAVGAVGWAVAVQLMSPLALGVAGFDLVSAIAIFVFARSLPRESLR